MRVVLLQDIKKVGRKFEVKNVADGYARNFLIPRGLAKIATEKILSELEGERRNAEKQMEALKRRVNEFVSNLGANPIVFRLKIGKGNTVFGSVTSEAIEEKLKDFFNDGDIKISLQWPLKTLGEHQVLVDFGRGVEAKIKILIEREV